MHSGLYLEIPELNSWRLSICVSVTLVHPATAVGQNETPFIKDTCVVQSSMLDRDPCPP